MALSLGAEGADYLEPGEFQSFLSYRWLSADTGYIGANKWGRYDEIIGADVRVQSIDLNLTYALSKRFSISTTAPFVWGRIKSRIEHGDGQRHTTNASGIGDVRLTANAWLWDPDTAGEGNLSLSFGFKAPTGNNEVKDTFDKPSGPERHPVDISIQPGDGGWGLVLEMQAFRKLRERTYGYATGFYLANPREQSESYVQNRNPFYQGPDAENSVPDQYQGRLGLSYALWPHQGVAVSLGARIDGITQKDLIGGSDGFRRPGYSLYVEPGLTLSRGKNTFSLYAPVTVASNREKNELDDACFDDPVCGVRPHRYPGASADYLIIFSVSRRF